MSGRWFCLIWIGDVGCGVPTAEGRVELDDIRREDVVIEDVEGITEFPGEVIEPCPPAAPCRSPSAPFRSLEDSDASAKGNGMATGAAEQAEAYAGDPRRPGICQRCDDLGQQAGTQNVGIVEPGSLDRTRNLHGQTPAPRPADIRWAWVGELTAMMRLAPQLGCGSLQRQGACCPWSEGMTASEGCLRRRGSRTSRLPRRSWLTHRR